MSLSNLPIPEALIPPQPYLEHPLLNFTRSSSKSRFNEKGDIDLVDENEIAYDFDPVTGLYKGRYLEEQRTRINTVSLAPTVAEDVTVTAQAYTVSFYGTGTVTLSGAHSDSLVGTGAFPERVTLTFTPTAGTLTLTPSGDVNYLQVEAGSFASSVILGEDEQKTRSADIADFTDLSWYNQAEGTMLIECNLPEDAYSSNQMVLSGDSALTTRIDFLRRTTLTAIQTIGVNAGSTEWGTTISPYSGEIKSATSYKENQVDWIVEGANVFSDTSAVIPPVTTLRIGNRRGSSEFFNGHIKSLLYYPRRLDNTISQRRTR